MLPLPRRSGVRWNGSRACRALALGLRNPPPAGVTLPHDAPRRAREAREQAEREEREERELARAQRARETGLRTHAAAVGDGTETLVSGLLKSARPFAGHQVAGVGFAGQVSP